MDFHRPLSNTAASQQGHAHQEDLLRHSRNRYASLIAPNAMPIALHKISK